MKNIEHAEKMDLGKLINNLRDGRYIIPDFQREFEWGAKDVVELLRSIFEDYYIGTLLFWRTSKDNEELLKCNPIYGFKGKTDPIEIVLDGQQRLSALYYAFFAPNIKFPRKAQRCFFFLKIDKILEENFEEAIYYDWGYKKNVIQLIEDEKAQFEKNTFPFMILGQRSGSYLKWLENYEKYWLQKINHSNAEKMREKFEKFLNDIVEYYEISYIELDKSLEISKVCDIFTRINNTGMELSTFDLLNSAMRPKGIYLKEEWNKVKSYFGVTKEEKMKNYLLQTISILKQGYCSPKYLYYLVPNVKKSIKLKDGNTKKITLYETKEDFLKDWKTSVEKIKQSIKQLQNPREYGIIHQRFFPYPTMIPIFTAITKEKELSEYKDKQAVEKKINQWYWASIITENYSSSVESQMTKDFEDLKKWFINDENQPTVISEAQTALEKLDLKNKKPGSAIYNAIINLIIIKGARDFDTFQLPENYENIDDHHIIPHNWGDKLGIGEDINSIPNRTPILSITNRKIINKQLPNLYLKKIFEKTKDKEKLYELLETHLISRKATEILLKEKFTKQEYEEFSKERENTIKKELQTIFNVKKSYKSDLSLEKQDI